MPGAVAQPAAAHSNVFTGFFLRGHERGRLGGCRARLFTRRLADHRRCPIAVPHRMHGSCSRRIACRVPPALDPLFRSLRSIKGVGPQLGALLTRFFGTPRAGRDRARPADAHARRASSTAGAWRASPAPSSATSRRCGSTSTATSRRRAASRTMPHRVFAHDETGEIQLVYLPRAGRLGRKAAAGRRGALRLRHHRLLQRRKADHPSRLRRRRRQVRRPCRWSSRSIRSPTASATKALTKLVRADARHACPSCPSGSSPSAWRSSAGRPSATP